MLLFLRVGYRSYSWWGLKVYFRMKGWGIDLYLIRILLKVDLILERIFLLFWRLQHCSLSALKNLCNLYFCVLCKTVLSLWLTFCWAFCSSQFRGTDSGSKYLIFQQYEIKSRAGQWIIWQEQTVLKLRSLKNYLYCSHSKWPIRARLIFICRSSS